LVQARAETRFIHIMTDTKIQGKFYPLQHEKWLRAYRELTPAEVNVFYHLNTITPYFERISIPYSIIASDLKGEKGRVNRAIQTLKAKMEGGNA
jgi:hypothetical protein